MTESQAIARLALYVAGLLVVATAAWLGLRIARPDRDWTELGARTKAWWVMAAVFLGAVTSSRTSAILLIALLSFWAMKEFITLIDTRRADHGALLWSFLTIPVQYYWIRVGWYGMFIIFVPVYMFLALSFRLVFAGETAGFVASASRIQWGLMAFVFGLSHLAFLAVMPAMAPHVSGRTLLLFVACVVEISDVCQYVWGKTMGRHKVMPSVSPNKTWEGLIGGVLSACLLSLSIRFLTPFTPAACLGFSLLICSCGFLGGAVMSAVKRDLGVKDFGDAIPGHGGVLDRIDSLCYAGPVFLHVFRYVYLS
jgi:phosphatidate cytidylyltransferase